MTLDLSDKGRHEMTPPSQRDLEFEKKLMADSRRPRTRPVSYPERGTRDKIEALEQGGLTVFQIMHEFDKLPPHSQVNLYLILRARMMITETMCRVVIFGAAIGGLIVWLG